MNTIILLAVFWFSSPPESLAEGYFKDGWAPRSQENMAECMERRYNIENYFRKNPDVLGDEGTVTMCLTVTEEMYYFLLEKYENDVNVPKGIAI